MPKEQVFQIGKDVCLSGTLPIQDLELMHQYSTSTCFTMTDQTNSYSLWQTDLPRLALEHPFLLHGLLALAAMHLYQAEPQPKRGQPMYTEAARLHQSRALSDYTPLLQSINETNCQALFAFSSVLGSLSYAFIRQSEDPPDQLFIKSIVDVFDLLVGAKIVVLEAEQWLRQGTLASFLHKDLNPSCSAGIPSLYDGLLLSLEGMLQEIEQVYGIWTTDDTGRLSLGAVYNSAIQELKKMIANSSIHEGLINRTIGWPVLINGHFITLLRQGDPTALIILAHYGALFTSINHVWWARGLGSRLVKAVVGVLGIHKFLRGPMVWAQ